MAKARQLVAAYSQAIARRCYDLRLDDYVHQLPACAILATLARRDNVYSSIHPGYILETDFSRHQPAVLLAINESQAKPDLFSPIFDKRKLAWAETKMSLLDGVNKNARQFSEEDLRDTAEYMDKFYEGNPLALHTKPGFTPNPTARQNLGNLRRDMKLLALWQAGEEDKVWQSMSKVHRKLRDELLEAHQQGTLIEQE
jgi:hypothetical protein